MCIYNLKRKIKNKRKKDLEEEDEEGKNISFHNRSPYDYINGILNLLERMFPFEI